MDRFLNDVLKEVKTVKNKIDKGVEEFAEKKAKIRNNILEAVAKTTSMFFFGTMTTLFPLRELARKEAPCPPRAEDRRPDSWVIHRWKTQDRFTGR